LRLAKWLLISLALSLFSFQRTLTSCTGESVSDFPDSLQHILGASGSGGKGKVVAFWHVYAEQDQFAQIVQEQQKVLESSGLYSKLDHVVYAVFGKHANQFTITGEKYVKYMYDSPNATELDTQQLLHQFCRRQSSQGSTVGSSSRVLYFHNKGSFHNNPTNMRFRRTLDCYNLNPHCLDALETHDVCGWRLTANPHIHYSGNFWWATCDYIKGLVSPLIFERNNTAQEKVKALVDTYANKYFPRGIPLNEPMWRDGNDVPRWGNGRYFAESWLGTGLVIRPADCLSTKVDSTYSSGYELPESVSKPYKYCPYYLQLLGAPIDMSGEVPHGSPCITSTVALPVQSPLRSKLAPAQPYIDFMVDKSLVFYGQKPTTLLEWSQVETHETA
jgi:hypothetical protein